MTVSTTNVSDKKIQANRRNAAKSTGPRTTNGKARSSRNATTHGLYCQHLVLPGESQHLFQTLREAWLLRLSPQDVLELLIVDRIVAAAWKLQRLQAAESLIHAQQAERMWEVEAKDRQQAEEELVELEQMKHGKPSALALARRLEAKQAKFPPTYQRYGASDTLAMDLISGDGGFERLTRLEQRLERSIHRNLQELRRLRNPEDPAERLEAPLRPCPFLAEEKPEQPAPAEDVAGPEVAEPAVPEESSIQNEAKPAASQKRSVQNEATPPHPSPSSRVENTQLDDG